MQNINMKALPQLYRLHLSTVTTLCLKRPDHAINTTYFHQFTTCTNYFW